MNEPTIIEIKAGWLAKGRGWAVEGPSREAAIQAYKEAQERHVAIDQRELTVHGGEGRDR